MHFCRRGIIRKYDLIAFLNFSMLLVAVKSLITLLCPAGIYILVALLVGIVIPQLITRSLFYLLIFITGVTLARGNNKTGINDATSLNCRPLSTNYEIPKKACHKRLYLSGVRDIPHRLLVRNIINTFNTKKLAETRTVNYLILYLMVTQTIITLKKQDLNISTQSIGGRPHYFCALRKKG